MSKLNDINFIHSLDKSDMHHLVVHLPEQIYLGYMDFEKMNPEFSNHFIPPPHYSSLMEGADQTTLSAFFSHIIICGMGGSAISADIARAMFEYLIPIYIVKDYNIPDFYIDRINSHESMENPLIIIISYSGNTEEAIECYQQALEITHYVVVITSGGKMEETLTGNARPPLPENNESVVGSGNLEFSGSKGHLIKVPSGLPPRAAIGYLFFSLLRVLEYYRIVPDHSKEVNYLIANLMQKAGSLCYKTETMMNLAKSSAEAIFPKIPIIYSSNPLLSPVAYKWKCQINENAKMPAFHNSFPELCHNEIEAFESEMYTKNLIPIFLRSFYEQKEYTEYIKKFQSLLQRKKIDYLEFFGETRMFDTDSTESILSQQDEKIGENDQLLEVFTLIYLGDIISFYLGILNGVDPTEIKNIDYIKRKDNGVE